MTKQFSLLQLFTLVDGRLSVPMSDVYLMIGHICDDGGLMTHNLPTAMDYIKAKNPPWFSTVRGTLDKLGCTKDEDFKICMLLIEPINTVFDIPQLKDEFDTSDFGEFMIGKSLLLRS